MFQFCSSSVPVLFRFIYFISYCFIWLVPVVPVVPVISYIHIEKSFLYRQIHAFSPEQAEHAELCLFINNLVFSSSGTVPEHTEQKNRNTGVKVKKKPLHWAGAGMV